MTEDRAEYKVEPKPGVIRPSCFLPYDQGFTPPTPAEVREMIKRLGMTGSEVANLVGIKSGRTVRKWQAENDVKNRNEIPYAAWQMLIHEYHRRQAARFLAMIYDEDISAAEVRREIAKHIRDTIEEVGDALGPWARSCLGYAVVAFLESPNSKWLLRLCVNSIQLAFVPTFERNEENLALREVPSTEEILETVNQLDLS